MAQNIDAMVREAIRTFKAGDRAKARTMLEEITEIDPHNEKAWMWLSAVVDSPEDQRICLENVLFINPENENARKGLNYLAKQTSPPQTPAPAPAPASPDPPVEEAIDDGFPDTDQTAALFDEEEPAPDMYQVPTSSASAAFDTNEQPSPDEYDDWVAGLNLGGGVEESQGPTTAEQPAFTYDDDLFADPFDGDEDSDFAALYDEAPAGGSSMTSGPFDADDLLEDFSAADLNYKEPVVEEDDLDTLLADLEDIPPSSANSAPVMSPEPPAAEQAAASRRKRHKRPAKPAVGPASDDLLLGGEGLDSDDPGEYFRAIPNEIKATRLPGAARSQAGRGPLIGLGILVLANLGAIGLLVLNMIA